TRRSSDLPFCFSGDFGGLVLGCFIVDFFHLENGKKYSFYSNTFLHGSLPIRGHIAPRFIENFALFCVPDSSGKPTAQRGLAAYSRTLACIENSPLPTPFFNSLL